MSFSQSVKFAWEGGSGALSKTVTKTGTGQSSLDETVATGLTDEELEYTLDFSAIKSVYIYSSQDVTLETNDGSSPGDTLALKANEPYVWHDTSLYPNLLTTDITSIFITNSSGAAANIRIEALVDASP